MHFNTFYILYNTFGPFVEDRVNSFDHILARCFVTISRVNCAEFTLFKKATISSKILQQLTFSAATPGHLVACLRNFVNDLNFFWAALKPIPLMRGESKVN